MNRYVLLCLLVVILPLQVLFTYIIHTGEVDQGLALDSVRQSATSVINRLHIAVLYYTTYDHLAELIFVPFDPKRKQKQSSREVHHTQVTGDTDTSSAKEVETFNKKNVYFARSESVRLRSSNTVEYNIGDVVRHKIDNYHGVIVGWDYTCQAPNQWLSQHGYLSAKNKELVNTPHYLILAHSTTQETTLFYVPQSHILREYKAKVKSTKLNYYFEKFSKSHNKYFPKDWLRRIYPEDK